MPNFVDTVCEVSFKKNLMKTRDPKVDNFHKGICARGYHWSYLLYMINYMKTLKKCEKTTHRIT